MKSARLMERRTTSRRRGRTEGIAHSMINLTGKIQRRENLPPPHWSPTGENGYWVFRDEKWKWYSDEEYKNLKENEE